MQSIIVEVVEQITETICQQQIIFFTCPILLHQSRVNLDSRKLTDTVFDINQNFQTILMKSAVVDEENGREQLLSPLFDDPFPMRQFPLKVFDCFRYRDIKVT